MATYTWTVAELSIPRSTLACPQDSAQMQLVVKYPEVLATDASAGTNSSGLLLAFCSHS